MEARRVSGNSTGAARCGRRLITKLQELGFEIAAYGSSDWNITPQFNHYRDQDITCLKALLEMIDREAKRNPHLERRELQCWYDTRAQAIESHQLGMIVHQLDVLATTTKLARIIHE